MKPNEMLNYTENGNNCKGISLPGSAVS